MTSASSSNVTPTSSDGRTSAWRDHTHKVRLRKIYKQARQESNRMYRSGITNTVTGEGYNSMLSSITSLRTERRRTSELGKTRKALFEMLAHIEGSDVRSIKRSFYDVRREDGMLRPEKATKNSELLKVWIDSTVDDRMNRWTKDDWDPQTTKLGEECNKSKRINGILMDDIKRLRSLTASRGQDGSTNNIIAAGLSTLDVSSADTMKRMRAKQAKWETPPDPDQVSLPDNSLCIELSFRESENDSLDQDESANK